MGIIWTLLRDYHFWLSVIDDLIGFAVLCVACVLMLSYLRDRPPEFEKKRIFLAVAVLCGGALLCRMIAHYNVLVLETASKNVGHLPQVELLRTFKEDYLKEALGFVGQKNDFSNVRDEVYLKAGLTHLMFNGLNFTGFEYEEMILIGNALTTVISFVCIFAGAFILMQMFRVKHILPMAIVQILGLLCRLIFIYIPYNKFITWICNRIFAGSEDPKWCGYNGFAYGCFMVLMIILYILATKYRFESFWTKDVHVGKHIWSVIILFLSYTFLIVIYNCIHFYMPKNHPGILFSFELMIHIFLAAVLLYVPKRTYDITRGELQEEFFEVKREEEVEQYAYLESRIKAERKYMHDLPGHFRELTSMAEKRGAEEITQYVQELDKKLIESKGEFSTGNSSLDNLLFDKLKHAQQYKIDILFNGVFPEKGIRRSDATTIFHNLIENAIEACKNVLGKREIVITSKIHEDRVYVSISNPFEQKVQKKHGKYETSKKNKAFHGYGLSSVESVVQKREYDGTFSTNQEGDLFISEVNLKYKR